MAQIGRKKVQIGSKKVWSYIYETMENGNHYQSIKIGEGIFETHIESMRGKTTSDLTSNSKMLKKGIL